MNPVVDKLRGKDKAVLQAIKDGNTDIQEITSATTLENHEVNYCFTKLQSLDLIRVEKQEGYTTRIIDGQKRTFKTPKKASLTTHGEDLDLDSENQSQYENLSHNELVQKIHQLEAEVEQLQLTIDSFRKQVQNQLLD